MTETGQAIKTIRSFVAVPLPEKVRIRVYAMAEELGAELPQLKVSRKIENLHVTVKFLGSVAESKLATFGDTLSEALRSLPRFVVEARGVGAFPSVNRARVLWVGIADEGWQLGAVAEAVELAAGRLGIGEPEDDRRHFLGHVTIGRCRGVDVRAALASHQGTIFGAVPVDEVRVYESQLGGDGSTYVLRHTAALGSKIQN